MEKYYTVEQICDTLQIDKKTVYRMIGKKLTATKLGRDWRISESSIADYLKSRTLKKTA